MGFCKVWIALPFSHPTWSKNPFPFSNQSIKCRKHVIQLNTYLFKARCMKYYNYWWFLRLTQPFACIPTDIRLSPGNVPASWHSTLQASLFAGLAHECHPFPASTAPSSSSQHSRPLAFFSKAFTGLVKCFHGLTSLRFHFAQILRLHGASFSIYSSLKSSGMCMRGCQCSWLCAKSGWKLGTTCVSQTCLSVVGICHVGFIMLLHMLLFCAEICFQNVASGSTCVWVN